MPQARRANEVERILDKSRGAYYNVSMATLYRKYRSQTFDDVIGQAPIITTLTNQIKLGRIGHAYLFTGSRGVGKTSCARIFARAVNCLSPQNGSPCGKCEACKALAADSVDIIEMDAASNNGVDDARDIREKVKYAPVSCKYKVYIIDEVHMLTGGAFNALLKTIEEPPEHVIFILATTEPQKLPQTILSRCIRFDFKLVSAEELAKHVARIYDAEGVKYAPDAVEEIARLGEGSVRDALSIADTLMSAADVITHEVVLTLTGAGDSAGIAALFDRTAARDVAGALNAIDGFAKNGKSMAAVAGQLTDYARNVLVVKSVGKAAIGNGLVNVDRDTAARIESSAEKFSVRDISRILESFGAAESGLKYSVNPRVYLETAVVKLICGSDREDELLKRIIALEKNSAVSAEQKKNNQSVTDAPPAEAASAPRSSPVDKDAASAVSQPAPSTSSVQPVPPARNAAPSAPPRADYDGYIPEPPPEPNDYCEPSPSVAPKRVADTGVQSAPRGFARAVPKSGVSERAGAADTVRASATAPPSVPRTVQSAHAVKPPDTCEVKSADEGEFMHLSATGITGMALFGKLVTFLRKRADSPHAARARELLSRGVQVKERDDFIAFIAPDDCFLSLGDESVLGELNAALDSCGIEKRAKAERTDESLMADDIERGRVLFGKDGIL